MASRWFLSELPARWRYTPFIAMFSAVLVLVMGLVMSFYEEQIYRSQKIREVTVQGEILAGSVTAALAFDDAGTAQEYINALKANPELEAAAVYDAQGAIVVFFERGKASAVPAHAERRGPSFENDRLHVFLPVQQNGQDLGSVYVRAVTESVERRLMRYGGIMLLVTMAALVLGVLGTAQGILARANAELQRRAEELAEANAHLHAEMEERAKAESLLRQSQKMEAIGQLSGGIAHDFNNLITIIKGNLQLLQRRMALGRTDVSRYIESATEGLNRAANLTQRILAFSRRQPLSPKPVDMSRLVAEIGELIRHSVGANIEIDMRLNAGWWIMCDANQMENVILNLAINARDAMPDGGKLTIETRNFTVGRPIAGQDIPPGTYVRLALSDTGTGMPEEVRQKAIDSFFTTKPPGQGTGLGLSMTFGYIRQSNGHLIIESEMGKGTSIIILMPRHETQEPYNF